ncbi:MAG TPA: hypothetical protein VEP49_18095 [Acidimicrobiia bacterium]|nr:hypothetical protein [Acidimicrobiia bacterium]
MPGAIVVGMPTTPEEDDQMPTNPTDLTRVPTITQPSPRSCPTVDEPAAVLAGYVADELDARASGTWL